MAWLPTLSLLPDRVPRGTDLDLRLPHARSAAPRCRRWLHAGDGSRTCRGAGRRPRRRTIRSQLSFFFNATTTPSEEVASSAPRGAVGANHAERFSARPARPGAPIHARRPAACFTRSSPEQHRPGCRPALAAVLGGCQSVTRTRWTRRSAAHRARRPDRAAEQQILARESGGRGRRSLGGLSPSSLTGEIEEAAAV